MFFINSKSWIIMLAAPELSVNRGPDTKVRYQAQAMTCYFMLIARYFLKSNVRSDVRFRDLLTAAFTVGFAESVRNSLNLAFISSLSLFTASSLKLSIIKFLSFSFILRQVFYIDLKFCSNQIAAISEIQEYVNRFFCFQN